MQNYKTLFFLLKKTESINFYLFVFFVLIGMVLETLSLGLLIPILTQVVNPDLILQYEGIIYFIELLSPIKILNYFNFTEIKLSQQKNIIITMFFIFTIFFIIKFIYMFFLEWLKSYYVYGVYKNIGNTLFSIYLKKPLMFHYMNNSSDLIANITSEISVFINNAVYPFVRMITEMIFSLGIFMFLLFYQSTITIFTFIFVSTTCYLFVYFSKTKINLWSKIRQNADFQRIKSFQQGLGAIEYIKLRGINKYFYNKFLTQNNLVSNVAIKQALLSSLPFYFLELIAVFALLFVALIMTFQNNSIENLIIILGLYTAASFKIIPSANRLLQAYSFIKYANPVINLFFRQLFSFDNKSEIITDQNVTYNLNENIVIQNISFSYLGSNRKIINNLSFQIKPLTTVGIIGESGSGKSTLIKIFMGFISPNEGQILINNKNINLNLYKWRSLIGYVSQNTYIIDDSIKRNIAIGIEDSEINMHKINKVIDLCQLRNFVNFQKNKLDTNLGEIGSKISGGEKQRIGIARALYHDPQILVLDEPTSSLDSKNEKNILDFFEKLKGKITILYISHNVESLKICDKIVKIK